MSYIKKVKWELVPHNLPTVKRTCPKCNKPTHYINTEKFRVNANKNNIDVWLIYQCENCRSTWNMTIYERMNPGNLDKDEYQKFLANDKDLAKEYGFNINIHNKNKADLVLEQVDYTVIQSQLDEPNEQSNEVLIEINCEYPLDIRMDKLLADKLNMSRSQIKSMCLNGMISCAHSTNILKSKVRHGMQIHYSKE